MSLARERLFSAKQCVEIIPCKAPSSKVSVVVFRCVVRCDVLCGIVFLGSAFELSLRLPLLFSHAQRTSLLYTQSVYTFSGHIHTT